jgi:hypothetical protein
MLWAWFLGLASIDFEEYHGVVDRINTKVVGITK